MGDGTRENPYTREDVLKLIEENGGKAEGLDLSEKTFEQGINLRGLNLKGIILNRTFFPTTFTSDDFRANMQPAQFQGANLMQAKFKKADLALAQLQGANLMASELQEAHLLSANLQGTLLRIAQLQDAYLSKAQLQGADLFRTKLEGASLHEAKFSSDTQLENAEWGNYILGEEKKGYFDSAVASYRHLKVWYINAGYSDIAAKFYYREKEANRKSLKWRSKHWNNRLALEILRVLFGYGERWRRVLISISVLILLFSLIYCVIGSVWEWSAFGNSLYFSAVSFTALGYGSWVQVTNGWIKGIGAFESLVGVSMLALLLVTFFRKWTR